MSPDKRPILIPIAVQRYVHFGLALKKAFNWPTAGVLLTERAKRFLPAHLASQFDRIYSFPDFHRQNAPTINAMDLPAVNDKQLELEAKYNFPTSSLLTSYDRDITHNGDYLTVRRRQLICMMFVDSIMSDIKPVFFMGTLASYSASLMTLACKNLKVPYTLDENPRTNQRVTFCRGDYSWELLPETMAALAKGDTAHYSPELLSEADKWYDDFVSKPVVPDYTTRGSRLNFSPVKSLGNALEALHPKLLKTIFTDKVDQAMGSYANPLKCLAFGVTSRIRALAQNKMKLLDDAPNLDRPFFYFPLHVAPEISDMIQGSLYDHPEGFLHQLAKQIPTDCQLYVKEHPGMVGRRSLGTFKRLKKIYNIKLISPSVSSFALTRAARGVFTVTGTAGLEAYMLGKPAVVFGKVFFNAFPGVLHCEFNEDFHLHLQEYLRTFDPDATVRRNAARAMFLLSFPSGDNHFFFGEEGLEQEEMQRQTDLFSQQVREYIRQRHHVMEGSWDADFLERIL